jgi:ribonuclease HI
MRNVAGEIKGAEAAIRYALSNGYKSITIFYDYQGIEKWCTGEWKTNKDGTKAYKKYCDKAKKKLEIMFVKVASHTNNKYNDMADALAKEALNIT